MKKEVKLYPASKHIGLQAKAEELRSLDLIRETHQRSTIGDTLRWLIRQEAERIRPAAAAK